MKRALVIIFVVAVVGAAGWFTYQSGALPWIHSQGQTGGGSTGSSAGTGADGAQAPWAVRVMGRVEPAGGVIDIAALTGDRVAQIQVSEGQTVAEGDTLALLASRSLREQELRAANSQRDEAKARAAAERTLAAARVEAAKLGVKKAEMGQLEIDAQAEKVKLAERNLELARSDQSRLEKLRKDFQNMVSEQEMERQKLVVQQAEAELSAARAMKVKLEETRTLSLEAAQADLESAKASGDEVVASIPVKSTEAQADLAQEQYDRTEIRAPCRGTVLKIFMRPGETITQRPILQMADLTGMVVVAEVYETDVKRVRVGQEARITSKAFRAPYDEKGLRGTVERVARMISAPALTSLNPTARSDTRVVEVQIRLDDEGSRQAAELVNLQVDVEILPEGEAARPSGPQVSEDDR